MSRSPLAVIVALYLALATAYAVVTPFGTPPDETAHALYVQHLVRERELPVLRRTRRDAYEYHQPPLYYLLAASFWAAASPGELSGTHAPLAPASPPLRSWMAARAVSILIGAAGIWLIAALGKALMPRGRPVAEALALAAAGFAAFLPMRLATAASVSNDTLAEAVFTAALLLMLVMIREGATVRRAAGLGVALGMGILTKSSDLLLFPVALVALLFASRSDRPPEAKVSAPTADTTRFLHCAAATFGVALLIGGGWIIRSALLYHDPLGTRAFEQYFQDTPTPDIWAQLLGYSRLDVLVRKTLPLTFESFWGVFGHMDRFMGAYPRGVEPPGWAYLLADHHYPPPSWVYPLLLLFTLISAAGLARQRIGGDRAVPTDGSAVSNAQRPTPNAQHLVLSFTAFLVLAAFLRFNTVFFQAQGRYLFPAMGPIALGLACGWLAWWPPRGRAVAVWLLLAGMLALALYALFGTLLPAFGGR